MLKTLKSKFAHSDFFTNYCIKLSIRIDIRS